MADERVVVVPTFRMPDTRRVAGGIEVIERVEQPVVRDGGNIAHGKRYGHIDVVRGVDERLVAQSLVELSPASIESVILRNETPS